MSSNKRTQYPPAPRDPPPPPPAAAAAVAASDGKVQVRFLCAMAGEDYSYRLDEVCRIDAQEATRFAAAGIVALVPAGQPTERR